MTRPRATIDHRFPSGRVLVSVVACVGLLGGAAAAGLAIFRTEPTAEREGAVRSSAALVEVMSVERGSFRPRISVLGEARPARDVAFGSLVSGSVVGVHGAFEPGSRVEAGTELVRIDPTDYEHDLVLRRSERRQVEADLEIERGLQELAREEYALLGDRVDEDNRALVLREPQLAALEARLEAAVAQENRARTDLARTRVVAPFDAMVMSRDIDVGANVGPGDTLGRLVGIEEFWIYARVPVRAVRWLEFEEVDRAATGVMVRHGAWGPAVAREARLSRLLGGVDTRSRLARVLVKIDDPLAIESDDPEILLGTVLQLEIEGRNITDVVRLPREHVRRDDTAWVVVDGALEIRDLEIIFEDADHAYVRTGLSHGDLVVVTTLATVSDGLPLKVVESEAGSP
jgi:RND family efflux transporter MFP subunit